MDAAAGHDTGQGRLAVLDGLRAMAILLVMMFHAVDLIGKKISNASVPFSTFFLNGWCGVDLFFVLSGFLITRQLLGGDTLLYFYKKRFMRIAPAYYVFLTLVTFTTFPPFPFHNIGNLWWRYAYHLLFLQDIFPSDIVPIFWSLAVEFHFYAVAPFLIAGLAKASRRKRYALIFLIMAGLAALKLWGAFYLAPGPDSLFYLISHAKRLPFALDGLMVGVTCAFLWNDKATRGFLETRWIATLLFCAGAVLMIALTGFYIHFKDPVTLFDKTACESLLVLAFGSMMLGLLAGCRGYAAFAISPLRFISRISYSLYLIHPIVVSMAAQQILAVLPAGRGLGTWLILFVFYFALSMVLAAISYAAIEKPCIDWSKRKKNKLT